MFLRYSISIMIIIVAMLLFGVGNFLYKVSVQKVGVSNTIVFFISVQAIMLLILAMWHNMSEKGIINFIDPSEIANIYELKYTFLAGFFISFSFFFYIYALENLEVGLAAPIRYLGIAITVILAILFLNEDLSHTKLAGILFFCISLYLLLK